MKIVVQEEPLGCGVACVASVAGISYKKAKHLFLNSEEAISGKCYCKDIVYALDKQKLNYNYAKVNKINKSKLKDFGTIIFLKRNKKYPWGHYIVRMRRGWMNPWINLPQITPARAGIEKKMPGIPQWIIYPVK